MEKSEVIPDDERPAYLKPEFLKEIAAYDPVKLLPTLKTARIRINQVDDNESTPVEAQKKIESALPATAEHRRFGSNTAFFSEVASGGRMFDWLKLQIKVPDAKVREAKKELPRDAVSDSAK